MINQVLSPISACTEGHSSSATMAFDRFTIHDQQGASARLLLVVSGVLGLGLLVIRQFKAYNAKPLPPGPKGRPFVGVLFDLPKHHAFLKLTEWARYVTHPRARANPAMSNLMQGIWSNYALANWSPAHHPM